MIYTFAWVILTLLVVSGTLLWLETYSGLTDFQITLLGFTVFMFMLALGEKLLR